MLWYWHDSSPVRVKIIQTPVLPYARMYIEVLILYFLREDGWGDKQDFIV